MITIFCVFSQFSAKIGVFLKYQCYDKLFSKFSFVLSQKRQFFAEFFWRKYFKNHNIGPRIEPYKDLKRLELDQERASVADWLVLARHYIRQSPGGVV
jgi:hypothetical protein